MSATKLRKRPISEQIAEYEKEINRIDVHISNQRRHQEELRRHIRILQRPDAEEKHQKRLHQYESQQRKKEELAQRQARMAREVEECLRMNGKII